jgi:DNA polymerase-3 subunit delta'
VPTLRDLVGQAHARALLRSAIVQKRPSHAYLFVGPQGVGRRTAALAFAQALLCPEATDDACGRCPACAKVEAGTHPDVRIVAPAGRTEGGAERRAVGIDQIREIQHDAAFPPYEAPWKVFIVEDAESMRAEAANSLLKVLEEPPPGVVLVLIAESETALLPTLVSRAQIVRFTFVAPQAIADALVARAGVAAERARYLAALAGGRVGEALALARAEEEAFARRARVLAVLAAVARGDPVARLEAAEEVARQRDEAEKILDVALLWVRDLLVWRETQDPALLVNLDASRDIALWAGPTDSAALARTAEALERAKAEVRRNTNLRLVVEQLFLQVQIGPPAEAPPVP